MEDIVTKAQYNLKDKIKNRSEIVTLTGVFIKEREKKQEKTVSKLLRYTGYSSIIASIFMDVNI